MKHLPLPLVSCLLLLCGLPTVRGGEDAPAPPPGLEDEEGELGLAVQMTVHAFREELEALRCMQDAASTVRAAARLRRAISLRYKLYGMCFNYDRYKEQCAALLGEVEEACVVELKRLAEKDFFGIMPVRAIFCSDHSTLSSTGETLRCADPLTPEETAAMRESRQELIARYMEKNAWLEGGPGFSRSCAWVVTSPSDVIPRERHLMRTLWQKGCCGQSLHCINGRYYDCLYVILTRDGEPCRMEQWFDITAYWQAIEAEN